MLWAFVTLLLLFNFWWAVAMNLDGSRDATVVAEFVLLAISPILLFLMCAGVLPRALPAEGQLDMRAEWAEARRVFLFIFFIRQICTGVTAINAAGGFVWDQAMVARLVIFALVGASLLTPSRRVEWVAVFGVLAMMVWRISAQSVH